MITASSLMPTKYSACVLYLRRNCGRSCSKSGKSTPPSSRSRHTTRNTHAQNQKPANAPSEAQQSCQEVDSSSLQKRNKNTVDDFFSRAQTKTSVILCLWNTTSLVVEQKAQTAIVKPRQREDMLTKANHWDNAPGPDVVRRTAASNRSTEYMPPAPFPCMPSFKLADILSILKRHVDLSHVATTEIYRLVVSLGHKPVSLTIDCRNVEQVWSNTIDLMKRAFLLLEPNGSASSWPVMSFFIQNMSDSCDGMSFSEILEVCTNICSSLVIKVHQDILTVPSASCSGEFKSKSTVLLFMFLFRIWMTWMYFRLEWC